MPTELAPIVRIRRFPFFVGARRAEDFGNLPMDLPLELTVDPHLAIVRLAISDRHRVALTQAYGMGSMLSTPLSHGSPPAKARLEETLAGVLSRTGGSVRGLRCLEVGCGTGELMHEMQSRGAMLTGCEIGPQGREATRRYGIPVLDRDLTPDAFEEPFDIIYSYGCLEHIFDVEGFLGTCRSLLVEGGLMFHSVPNFESCLDSLRTEDLCHQHVSYFTPESGARLLSARGFADVRATPTRAGNELHLSGRRGARTRSETQEPALGIVQAERRSLAAFGEAWRQRLDRTGSVLRTILARGESVGFYAGGFSLAVLLDLEGDVRFYDGDSRKHGLSWLSGQTVIRSPASLSSDPVDHLVICAEHHFYAIAQYLRTDLHLGEMLHLRRLSEMVS